MTPSSSDRTPTGAVTIRVDGKTLAQAPLTVVDGRDQATFRVSTLAVGRHTVTAVYQGDASFNPGNPATGSVTITSRPSVVNVQHRQR